MGKSVSLAQAPATEAGRGGRPNLPSMLSHAAYVTSDTAATTEFFTEVLGMELVNAVLDDAIPSTGEPVPYFHSFFRMRDGSTVGFFDTRFPPPAAPTDAAYDTFHHLALQVDSPTEVDAWCEWLRANGVDVIGPVDHKIIYSIYFHEPGGLRMEITTPLEESWNDNAEGAHTSLDDWVALKARAEADGEDLTVVVKAFTVERSHRRAMGAK